MPFQPGRSGNPGGRPRSKPITRAIQAELRKAAESGDGRKLQALASKLVELAIAGNVQAIAVVLDRIEGKVPQPLTGDDAGRPLKIEIVRYGDGAGAE